MGAPPVSVPGQHEADPEGALAERSLASLPQFEKSLDVWFQRKNVPVWITEYGHETKPGEPQGVTESQQAAYIKQALRS